MRLAPLFILSILVVTFSGCAARLKGDLVTFHENSLPRGETIRVEPMDTGRVESLEFRHYAGLVSQRLGEIGYTPVESDQPAQLIAKLDYTISEGQTEIRHDRGSYVRYHFYYGRYYHPFYYGFSQDLRPEIHSTTVYNRTLSLNIVDPADGDRVIFEGRVQSVGPEKEIASVMPYMITALFSNYPGESGVTKVVTVEKS